MRSHIWLAIAVSAPMLWTTSVLSQDKVEIEEWQVPWSDSRPRDPDVAPDGRIWFVGQRSDYIAILNPEDGAFERIDLDDGAGPHNLIVGDDSVVWYAGNRQHHIGRIDPVSHEIHKIEMPDPAASDPHTLVFDDDGHIWFTVQGGNFVGRMTLATEEVDLIPVPTGNARPYGIIVEPDGRPWIALFGTNKLATVDPGTMQLTEIDLPEAGARPRRIGRTSDGRIWYGDYRNGRLGRYDPETGAISEWNLPSGSDARPYAMAVDDADTIWVFETGPSPNRLVGFNPGNEEFVVGADVPSGGGTVRHAVFDPETGYIWFGADTNTIGRAKVR